MKKTDTMKKISLLAIALIMSALPMMADLTVLVMDSMQSLIPDAQVTLGKQSVKTRADGKAVFTPVVGKLVVTCEGYEKQTRSIGKITKDSLILIALKHAKVKVKPTSSYARGTEIKIRGTGSISADVRYSKARTMATADMVYAEEEVAMDVAPLMMAAESSYSGKKAVANNAVSAGKLTAGEVNDFARWNYWQHVLGETHKQYIDDWRILAQDRYVVQVTNRNGYPFANIPVNLIDAQGNTLYQTVTDNTGKAELWNNLTNGRKAKGTIKANGERTKGESLRVIVNGKKYSAKPFSEGCNAIELDEACEAQDGVDVFFIFDATGSMGDELRYLQAEMRDVIARAEAATGGLSIRTGAVVYRDHGDEYLTRISRLTSRMSTTQAFIDKQEANGGGDFPEAIPEALMAALNSAGWDENARTRIAFLILDAPCHTDSATIALLHEQILNAAAMGVRIVPVVCSGLDKSGELLMRSIALATNGTSFFLTDDSGIGETHLKPTTDSLKVEHLNDMLVRTIVEFSYMPDCTGHWNEEQISQVDEHFIPNPFDTKDLSPEEITEKDSHSTLYLLDITGKLIMVYQGRLEDAGDAQLSKLRYQLSTGIYFVKAFYNGEWHTKKILVH